MASNTELQLDWLILCKNKENWDNTGKYTHICDSYRFIKIYCVFNIGDRHCII